MLIGIDASRAFIKQRTGIEEYSYQVIKHLREELKNERVFLYIRKNQKVDFTLPDNWKMKVIKFPYLWTQVGLSLELLFHPADVLFIPAHIVPIIHPRNTIVTIHGLEYEIFPKAYSFWERLYMRWSIKKSCQWAEKIIAVSENTKKDLINLYKVPEEKIEVIYEGVVDKLKIQNPNDKSNPKSKIQNYKPYLLFVGRLEERKNICGIIEAYKILKEKYQIPHDLILAGLPGYGYEIIKLKISAQGGPASGWKNSKIIELGYVDEASKWQLLFNADVFLFPTFYEGFGLPILEAQSVGVPVVASDNSSIPEIVTMKNSTPPFGRGRSMYSSAGEGSGEQDRSALLVDPNNPEQIAEATYKLISDKTLRGDIIEKGYENVNRFSWKKCARDIASLITQLQLHRKID